MGMYYISLNGNIYHYHDLINGGQFYYYWEAIYLNNYYALNDCILILLYLQRVIIKYQDKYSILLQYLLFFRSISPFYVIYLNCVWRKIYKQIVLVQKERQNKIQFRKLS